MALSVEASSPSPTQLNMESPMSLATTSCSSSPQLISPTSDKRFWSTLRGRVETILENRNAESTDQLSDGGVLLGSNHRAKRLKEDTLLLLRGFDSVADSLSQLTSNLDNALQGTRELAKAPTLTDIFHSMSNMEKNKAANGEAERFDEKAEQKEDDEQDKSDNKGVKRKLGENKDENSTNNDDKGENLSSLSSDTEGENEHNTEKMMNPVDEKLKKAKSLAVSMATKSASLAMELKTVKSDLCFAQERCALLEEENRRLREGFSKGIRPDEDDLVRMQLEALLAEKSKLANDNANLTRENQCLRQLVEYHQFANQDISATFDQEIEGICLDFSSPPPLEEEATKEEGVGIGGEGGDFEFCTSLDHRFAKEEQQFHP